MMGVALREGGAPQTALGSPQEKWGRGHGRSRAGPHRHPDNLENDSHISAGVSDPVVFHSALIRSVLSAGR